MQFGRADAERLTQSFADLGSDCGQIGLIAGIGDQQQEFIAPDARDGIDLANGAGETVPHLLEQLISGAMAERVVDLLESIEVEQQYGEQVTIALSVGDFAAEPIHEEHPVR
jgi:hypothetical protein